MAPTVPVQVPGSSLLGTSRYCMRYPTIDRIHAVQRVMIPSPGQVILGPGRTLSAHPLHGSGESHPMVAGWVKMALPLRM